MVNSEDLVVLVGHDPDNLDAVSTPVPPGHRIADRLDQVPDSILQGPDVRPGIAVDSNEDLRCPHIDLGLGFDPFGTPQDEALSNFTDIRSFGVYPARKEVDPALKGHA